MSRPLSLVDHVRLCRVALAIARADPRALEAALDECLGAPPLTPETVTEAILQGVPYSGFPGAIEALGSWRARFGPEPDKTEAMPAARDAHELSGPTIASDPVVSDRIASDPLASDLGAELFARVYGNVAARVRSELRSRDPRLEQWIISFAYGEVMGRSRLSLASIEVLGVAALLGQGRRAPLHSHLRGALRNGWSPEQLDALLAALERYCDGPTVEFARRIVREGR